MRASLKIAHVNSRTVSDQNRFGTEKMRADDDVQDAEMYKIMLQRVEKDATFWASLCPLYAS